MGDASGVQVMLPEETLTYVKRKVTNGEFSSESDLINECIATFRAQDEAAEQWLQVEGVPAYERYLADRSRGIPFEELKSNLACGNPPGDERS